jgi:hypothetical protein
MAAPNMPMNVSEALDRYFLEMRGKVLEVAAALDRVQRAKGGATASSDYRMTALRKAIEELLSHDLGRAERVLTHLSDMTEAPIAAVKDPKAHGAPKI